MGPGPCTCRVDLGAARRACRRSRRVVEESFTPAEDTAVHDLISAFEDKTGKQVELVRQDVDQQTALVQAAIDAGRPPDFLFGQIAEHVIPRWAEEGRLVVELHEVVVQAEPGARRWVPGRRGWRGVAGGCSGAASGAGRRSRAAELRIGRA